MSSQTEACIYDSDWQVGGKKKLLWRMNIFIVSFRFFFRAPSHLIYGAVNDITILNFWFLFLRNISIAYCDWMQIVKHNNITWHTLKNYVKDTKIKANKY